MAMGQSSTPRSSADVRANDSPLHGARGRQLLVRLGAAVLLLAAGLTVPAPPAAAADTDPTRTPASPTYTVSLTSDATGSTWTGHQSVTFTNPSVTPLAEVYLRLWDNFHGTCPSTPVTVSNVTGGTAGVLEV